ncbi:hypothetical protein C7212DRAFT_346993 [Tuber magnatum]|uniref:Uncharacterized protein n=1 Tax=Tuber magnatum TaxID=42249 RepID=A0A317SFF5_9PEZI|nr:hypothetical protein C7212DRAFT_346993 [Tuber magnatum]
MAPPMDRCLICLVASSNEELALLVLTLWHHDAPLVRPIGTLDVEQLILTETDIPAQLEINLDNELPDVRAGKVWRFVWVRKGENAQPSWMITAREGEWVVLEGGYSTLGTFSKRPPVAAVC